MSNVPEEVMANVVWGKPRDGHSAQKLALMRAALSALEAVGWVCVPKVPTQQMLEAAASVWKEGYSIGYRHPITRGFSPALGGPSSAEIYAAMLTASRKERP